MTQSGSGTDEARRTCMVLGYDGSESSRRAVQWAANELAAGGKLVVVYACWSQHLPPSPLSTAGERREEGRAVLDELMLEGDDALFDLGVVERLLQRLDPRG